MADVISGIFVPIVVGIAVVAFLIWYLLVTPGDFAEALEKAIAILVIACPCALGLATPTSIMAGSGRAELGILFKGGEHLEQTHKIDAIILTRPVRLRKVSQSSRMFYPKEMRQHFTVGRCERKILSTL